MLRVGPLSRQLPRRAITPPFRKDYDALPGNHPTDWAARFGVDRAQFFAAYHDGQLVGGAVCIVDTLDVVRLGGDPDFALLWDLRVAVGFRGRGIGLRLLAAAETGVQQIGGVGITAETQDINVAACALYIRAGYFITRIEPGAYPDLPDEVRIIWSKAFGLLSQSG